MKIFYTQAKPHLMSRPTSMLHRKFHHTEEHHKGQLWTIETHALLQINILIYYSKFPQEILFSLFFSLLK